MDVLEKATIAAAQENWSLLNQCVRQILGEEKLAESDLMQILHWSIEVLEAGDFQERWDVAKVFPSLGSKAIAPLIAILEDEDADEELRWFVARILGEFNDPAVISALVDLLKTSESEELSAMAAAALANLGKGAIAALTDLLANSESRLLAVRGLAHIRTKEAIAPLLEVVGDEDVQVRAVAIEALSSFHDSRIPPVLLEALKDIAAPVRREAAIALGVRTDLREELDLVNVLRPLLWDFNLEVCQQAAIALGRLGTDSAADALFELLQSPATPIPLQLEAIRSLVWVGTPKAISYLQQLLWKEADLSIKPDSHQSLWQEIIAVLGRVEHPDLAPAAAEILIDVLKSNHPAIEHPNIKQAVAVSLGQLGNQEAIDPLMEMLKDADLGVRLHAIAALKKFPSARGQLAQLVVDENLSFNS